MAVKVKPDYLYTKTHEWVRLEDEYAYVGISDYAQDQLSDIVYVEMPEVGDSFSKGEVFGVVESVKAASDCYLPLAGEVVEINEDLEDSPDTVNRDPYGDGWFIKVLVEDPDEARGLMNSEQYQRYLDKVQKEGGH